MRIACIHQGYELYGSDRCFIDSVAAVRAAWPSADIEVVLPRDGPIVAELQGVATRIVFEPILVLRRRDFGMLLLTGLFRVIPALWRALRRFIATDLVYVNTVVVLDYLIVAHFFAKKTLVHVHEIPQGAIAKLFRWLLGWPRAELIFNSNATRAAYGLSKRRRQHVVYNGYVGPADPTARDYDGARPLRLLLLGRINRIKGQDLLIEALALLPREIVERLDVRIVGETFDNDVARESSLHDSVRAHGLQSTIRFEPFRTDPAALYQWADIVVVPSRLAESLGKVAIEAMAFARPALVTAIGGLVEVVEDGVTGWVIPPNDATALARKITDIVARPESWINYSAAARARFEEKFTSRAIAQQIQNIFRLHQARIDHEAHRTPLTALSAAPTRAKRSSERLETIAPMQEGALAFGRRYLLSLSGEAVQSGFHFVLNLVLIGVLSAYDYGIFAIVFVLGGIALTYSNALVSVPAAVYIPKLKHRSAVNFQDVVFSSFALAILCALAAVVAAGLWVTTGHAAESLAGGAFTGSWALRNHVRTTLFARRFLLLSTLSDLSYSFSGIAMIAAAGWLYSRVPQVTFLLWMLATANAIAIAVALRSAGLPIRISFRPSVVRRYRTIWSEIVWSLIGVTTWSIQGQAPMFIIAAFVGPAGYAPIAAGLVLFNPLRTALGAFINVVRPEFASGLSEHRIRQVKLVLYSSSAMIILFCLSYGTAIWLSWNLLDAQIYGNKFAGVSMTLIVVLAGVSALIYLTYHVPLSLLQAAHQFRAIALATTVGGLVALPAVVVMLLVSSPAWSLAGYAVGEAACWVCLWSVALRVLRKETTDTRDAPGLGGVESVRLGHVASARAAKP